VGSFGKGTGQLSETGPGIAVDNNNNNVYVIDKINLKFKSLIMKATI
jgi:hypothetical protein